MKKFIFIIILVIFCYFYFFYNKKDIYILLNDVENDYVSVNKYYVYGNHLNMSGSISNISNANDVKLVLKSINNEISYDINYSLDDSVLDFHVSNFINDGIYLDDIPVEDYFMFLKISNGDSYKYYSLRNDTNYNDINYYTITQNGVNNLININFSDKNDKDYMMFSVNNSDDNNYYDVVIDAGHGGIDPGASYSDYNEADITLDYAISLKESLEELGLKVKLTRTDDSYIDSYGYGSRTSIPHEVKAKYVFSIHLNSCEDINYGGVEIYSPNGANLEFASSLASNIVKNAKTSYSRNESFKISDGVYVRTFTKSDIKESVSSAKNKGYNPYPITNDTTYYFMIRETGGIVTNAYVDGRNKDYSKNDYYDSNVGVEAYLLELGYINYKKDLNNLLLNKEGYVNGITNALREELNL